MEGAAQPVTIDRCVSTDTITAHLGLLHRFDELTLEIKAGVAYLRQSVVPDEADARRLSADGKAELRERAEMLEWTYYCRAELRYIKWLQLLKRYGPGADSSSVIVPPLDVALFWHAHMLNPLRYYEDTYWLFENDVNHIELPLLEMHSIPGPGYDPPQDHKQIWENYTNFQEPFSLSKHDVTKPIVFPCPRCNMDIQHEPLEYVTFRMRKGRLECPTCARSFSCDTVSVLQFLGDLGKFYEDPTKLLKGSALSVVSSAIDVAEGRKQLEMLFKKDCPGTQKPDKRIHATVSEMLRYSRVDPRPDWDTLLRKHFRERLNIALRLSGRVVHPSFPTRLVKAYRNIPFKEVSLDLIAAVVRQRGFTAKMVSGAVDWSNQNVLAKATTRYHKFLMLIGKYPGEMLVPTLDLDLAWHTHQLHPHRYQSYGIQNAGRIINHDDSIEMSSLSTGYDITSSRWKSVFNEDYSQDLPDIKGKKSTGFSHSMRLPLKSIFSGSKSKPDGHDHRNNKQSTSLGACTFYDTNGGIRKLRDQGELGRYSQTGAKCTVCGTSVLLSCAGVGGNWEQEGKSGKSALAGGLSNGACAAADSKVSGFLFCGSKGGKGYEDPNEQMEMEFLLGLSGLDAEPFFVDGYSRRLWQG
ncbi:hypothetical protein BJ742DRAFT_288865 [Cladochytrium replicatum]|nr:hypothetical protein BJ742DRAFT_288865 [Cladochytrium replicatum]